MSAQQPNDDQSSDRNPSRRHSPTAGRNHSPNQNQRAQPSQPGSRRQPRSQASRNSRVQSNRQTAKSRHPEGNEGEPEGIDVDELVNGEKQEPSARHTTRGAVTSLAGSVADDEWSDYEAPKQALTERQPLTRKRYGRSKVCNCYPRVSNTGQPSMIYEQLYCKHNNSTGEPHDAAKPFWNNWSEPGALPPIHKTDFVVKRKPTKPPKFSKYTLLEGYPTSMYGYQTKKRLNEVPDVEDQVGADADVESDEYTDDSDAEPYEGDLPKKDKEEDKGTEGEGDEMKEVNRNRRDLYKQKVVRRTVVSSFPTPPRAMVSEPKSYLEEAGYLAGDKVHYNYDYLEARLKRGRNLNGKLFNQASGKVEHFNMKTEGLSWHFNKELVNET